MKKCTWCGKEYDDTATTCALDSEPLEPVALPPIPRQRQSLKHDEAPVQRESLIFPRNVGRISFVVRFVLFLVAVWIGALLLTVGSGMEPGFPAVAVHALAMIMLLVGLLYFIRHGVVARLRDIGMHGLFMLLIFVPIVNIIFLLILAFFPKDCFKEQTSKNAA
jgi:uncharacterized membrane protein YhaH (DUF805 family)